jgi:ABC-type sulfate transport system permease component
LSGQANKARRFWREPEFWLLVVAALASTLGLAVWIVVPLTAAGLSISSLPKYIELWPRARAVGAETEWWKTVLLSMLNSLAAACAAFLFGTFSRWLWF